MKRNYSSVQEINKKEPIEFGVWPVRSRIGHDFWSMACADNKGANQIGSMACARSRIGHAFSITRSVQTLDRDRNADRDFELVNGNPRAMESKLARLRKTMWQMSPW